MSEAAVAKAGVNSVRVEIYDQSYSLRGSDPEHIFQLAEYVDGKMRVLSEQTATVDSLRLAVLAALNIADELHVLRRKYENVASEYNLKASNLSGALDRALEENSVEESRLAG